MLGKAKIIAHGFMGDPQDKIMRLVVQTDMALEAKPGQFVHVQVAKGLDPLLRRPISIAGIDQSAREITLLYRIKGKGTELLAERKVGEDLDLMGPLGHGFTLPAQGELILVAGGIGAFPLLPLAQAAQEKNLLVSLYWGGENEGFFRSAGLALWQEANVPVFLSSLDGSIGEKGTVLDLLYRKMGDSPAAQRQEQLSRQDPIPRNDQTLKVTSDLSVAICGPQGMMKVVSEYFLAKGAYVEVSLEERMGCAVGACLGCVCTLKDEISGKVLRGKVCKDGPVFRGKEVLWDYEQ